MMQSKGPLPFLTLFLLGLLWLPACGEESAQKDEESPLEMKLVGFDAKGKEISPETSEGVEFLNQIAFWEIVIKKECGQVVFKDLVRRKENSGVILPQLPHDSALTVEVKALSFTSENLLEGVETFDYYVGRKTPVTIKLYPPREFKS
ncbi:MAG: hypothetical protein HY391_05260 [Deltaproteobacteria bacterium]|nr:hypothetical protein [Deltaproteobacteria bacterium]